MAKKTHSFSTSATGNQIRQSIQSPKWKLINKNERKKKKNPTQIYPWRVSGQRNKTQRDWADARLITVFDAFRSDRCNQIGEPATNFQAKPSRVPPEIS